MGLVPWRHLPVRDASAAFHRRGHLRIIPESWPGGEGAGCAAALVLWRHLRACIASCRLHLTTKRETKRDIGTLGEFCRNIAPVAWMLALTFMRFSNLSS